MCFVDCVLLIAFSEEKKPCSVFHENTPCWKVQRVREKEVCKWLVAYVDRFDIDQFSVHKLNVVMKELGYFNDDPIYYHYMIPGIDLDIVLRALGNDLDVLGLAKYIKDNKMIMVYCKHIDIKLNTYASP
ncbi:hypothetical protein Tco_0321120 [Tanacetum coccineum]